MTVPYRKKLIEVGLPLVAINAESAREKSIRHGHPSTLHLWWARRPLAACRAVLFSSLVDDPDSDPQYLKADGSVDEEAAGTKRADLFNLIEELVMWENSNNPDVIRTARAEIARCVASRLIETGALKKDSTIGTNTTANDLVKRGHCRPIALGLDTKVGRVRFSFDVSRLPPAEVVNAFLAAHAPPVLDPFAGGGSIPLEAQRLGLRAYASDLNPVPVLINKALIEIPPKFAGRPPVNPESRGENSATKGKGKKSKTLIEKEWHGAAGLAEDVRYYGQWMRDEAEKRIGHLYPKVEITAAMAKDRPDLLPYVGQKLTVIAWIWARTVASPDPSRRGAHVPLVKSFWLSTKRNRTSWVNTIIDPSNNSYRFDVSVGGEGPKIEGTVNRKGGRCILSDSPIPFDHIRTAGKAGQMSCRLMAIVAEGNRGRVYVSPLPEHEEVALKINPAADVPVTEMAHNPFSLRPPLYGLSTFAELFSRRQMTALTVLSDLLAEVRNLVITNHQSYVPGNTGLDASPVAPDAQAYADAVITYLAFAIDKGANYWSSMCAWSTTTEKMVSTFGRQAIPMVWDFAEANPFSDSSGNFLLGVDQAAKYLERCATNRPGHCRQHDAAKPYSEENSFVISTDPPYYNNIDYADLSDFFYIWLRRSLRHVYPELFSTLAVPKSQEIVASPYRFGGDRGDANRFFESSLHQAFTQMRNSQDADYPLSIFYAFKQVEDAEDGDESDANADEKVIASTGWETMLEGLIKSGFSIRGTWPMRTELTGNLKKHMNALASSVLLVGRPRATSAALATRKEFIATLRGELPAALRNLQRGNIAPVDLAQAAIGPGMAVFTRYAKVIESDGSAMTVRTALGIINQSLDEVLAEQEGEFDGDTRWALAWFEQFGMNEGPFGDAEILSKAKDTAVNRLVEAGIIVAHAGKVRLIQRDELPADWTPATDKRLAVWEVTQHLIRMLDQQGELGTAALVQQLGGIAEISRDLAYRLYSTCERKKWAQEAMAYNGLVIAWPELTKLALSNRNRQIEIQKDLFS
jgi:putative DNA methylase